MYRNYRVKCRCYWLEGRWLAAQNLFHNDSPTPTVCNLKHKLGAMGWDGGRSRVETPRPGSVEMLAERNTYGTLRLKNCKAAVRQAELPSSPEAAQCRIPIMGLLAFLEQLTGKTNTQVLRKSPLFTWWLWKKALFVVLSALTKWGGSSYNVFKSSSVYLLTNQLCKESL